ncbi:MAG: SLC13 family permease, partial [Planctomycetota bacterium]
AADHGARALDELFEDFGIGGSTETFRVGAGSTLAGRTIGETALGSAFGVRVIGVVRSHRRGEERITAPAAETELHERDVLLLVGAATDRPRLVAELGLVRVAFTARERQRWLWEQGGAAVLIHPESRLIGKSLRDVRFRSTYGLHVLGVRRAKSPVDDFEDTTLRTGDSLFVLGAWPRIDRLQAHAHDFVVTELPRERADIVKAYRKMPVAIAILVIMVLLVLLNLVPLVAAVILAALAAVFTRCLTMDDAYRAIHWSSIVLVAGMLPLADALERTGGVNFVVGSMMSAIGDAGPRVVLTAVFFLTAGISLFLSNTAAAVLTAPIAIYAAKALDVSPYPFAVAVVIAASAAFSTPVATPVVTLVVEPGRYRFVDYVKVGVPLLLLTWLVTLVLAPIIFPFDGFTWPPDPIVDGGAGP